MTVTSCQIYDSHFMSNIWQSLHVKYMTVTSCQIYDSHFMSNIWQSLHVKYMTVTSCQIYDSHFMSNIWQSLHVKYMTVTSCQIYDSHFMSNIWQSLHELYFASYDGYCLIYGWQRKITLANLSAKIIKYMYLISSQPGTMIEWANNWWVDVLISFLC